MVKLADVHAARGRIQDGIVQTPCKPTQAFGDDLPCKLFWKFENLQFAMRESSKRPSMAFVMFTREVEVEGSTD